MKSLEFPLYGAGVAESAVMYQHRFNTYVL
jgi:hypothetical protein